jgi:hypothetical protein
VEYDLLYFGTDREFQSEMYTPFKPESGTKSSTTRTIIAPEAADYTMWFIILISGSPQYEIFHYYFGTSVPRAAANATYNPHDHTLSLSSSLEVTGSLPLWIPNKNATVPKALLIDKVLPIVKIESTGQILLLNGTLSRDANTNTVVTTYIVNENLVGKNLQIQFETEGENYILKSPVITVQVQEDPSAAGADSDDINTNSGNASAMNPCSCTPRPVQPLGTGPVVVNGYIVPEKHNTDVVNLLAIPFRPGYEFSFVARLFSAVGGQPKMLAETRTPWSPHNGVPIRKPLTEKRVGGSSWIQYMVYVRARGTEGPVVVYLFS